MNKDLDLLTIIGDLYDVAVDYAAHSKSCSEEDIKLMLLDLIKQITDMNDFIFNNIDLDQF